MTQADNNDALARQSAVAAAGATAVVDQYVVRQHPAGDRYIITAKSVGASPAPSSAQHATPRSVASAPGRRPARSIALGGGRGRDAFVRSRDHERRADEQYLQYYSSWKHIATSKTEKEADELIMSAIQRSPMRRFLAEAGDGARAQFLNQVLDSDTRPVRPKVPKPVTLQDKRKRQLALMKQSWGIVDGGASKNNEKSLEAFLTEDSATNTSCTSRRGSLASTPRNGAFSNDKQHPRGLVRGGGGGARGPQHGYRGTPSPASAWEFMAPTSPLMLSRNATGTPRRLAEEAREALESLGIQRPPSTARRVATGTCVTAPGRGPGSTRLAVFAEQEVQGDENHMPVQLEFVDDHKTGACEVGGSLSAARPTAGENTFSARMHGVEAGKRTALVPPPLTHVQVVYSDTPRKGCTGDEGIGPGGASPAASDDVAWDAELDDLLKWTDQLSPLPA